MNILTATLTAAMILGQSGSQETDSPVKPVRVLLVTGVDYPGHLWKKTAPVVKEILEAKGQMNVRTIEDPSELASDDVFDYDVIVLHFKNYKSLDNEDKVRANLKKFVASGGGLAALHFACGAFEDWPEFKDLIGKVWDRKTGHDPRGPFTVKIVDAKHPITRGMKDFQADDELYTCLVGDKPVDLLATARSIKTGKDHPMAFAFSYGKGRVFQTPLGHDVKAFQMEGVAELLRRGCVWTAGK